MKTIYGIEFHTGSREEALPDFITDFPYTAPRVELDKQFVPWHWHKAVELFYMEAGVLEYSTPKGRILFPAGSGGLVNSNILHMTRTWSEDCKVVQLLHIFDPSFIGGQQGSRIEQKYIMPIVAAPQLEIFPLYPENPLEGNILTLIQKSFQLSKQEFGYEMKLREILSDIWLSILAVSYPALKEKRDYDKRNDKIKMMMIYIHEHYQEKITIPQLAAAAFLSERECFRVFRDCLHMTPVEYMKNYRLQIACEMLAKESESITSIGHACGLGSSSYFGKLFREYMGLTPLEYRCKWQNNDKKERI